MSLRRHAPSPPLGTGHPPPVRSAPSGRIGEGGGAASRDPHRSAKGSGVHRRRRDDGRTPRRAPHHARTRRRPAWVVPGPGRARARASHRRRRRWSAMRETRWRPRPRPPRPEAERPRETWSPLRPPKFRYLISYTSLHYRLSADTTGDARKSPDAVYAPFDQPYLGARTAARVRGLTPICRVELRVLGPLEVIGPHGPIAIDGRLERALLAYLVARLGRSVPADELVEALGGRRRAGAPGPR